MVQKRAPKQNSGWVGEDLPIVYQPVTLILRK